MCVTVTPGRATRPRGAAQRPEARVPSSKDLGLGGVLLCFIRTDAEGI